MLSQIFRKSQQSRENKREYENLQRICSSSEHSEYVDSGTENKEEDGFCLLGETEKERNTVKPSSGAPPPYGEHQQFALCTGSCSVTPNPRGSHSNQPLDAFQPINTNQSTSSYSSKMSPLNGVPFKLSDTTSLILGNTLSDMSVPSLNPFEPHKFSYDFSHERSVVKDL